MVVAGGGIRGGTIPAGAGSAARCRRSLAGTGDHPRGRGEHRKLQQDVQNRVGPSPRARGAQSRSSSSSSRFGTIPAGPGSTPAVPAAAAGVGDHPRGRGEHDVYDAAMAQEKGPSPRARGARPSAAHLPGVLGTIPAGAGSTLTFEKTIRNDRDHPRGRGEHAPFERPLVRIRGPSPRARGARLRHHGDARLQGTIPAGAGSTFPRTLPIAQPWDHPRGRGEHRCASCAGLGAEGPSPQARGAPDSGSTGLPGLGTIPAGAGSTPPPPAKPPPPRDHPRGRGEHSSAFPPTCLGGGPSPRARGAPPRPRVVPDAAGTIPAGAGSTTSSQAASTLIGDHPRGRGEHGSLERAVTIDWGPSPRARGAPGVPARARLGSGTIPAGAGSTRS